MTKLANSGDKDVYQRLYKDSVEKQGFKTARTSRERDKPTNSILDTTNPYKGKINL